MPPTRKWTFTARFRNEAYGWRASPLATEVALVAIRLLVEGKGYEPTPLDIAAAHRHLTAAAERLGATERAVTEVQELVSNPSPTQIPAMREALAASLRNVQPEAPQPNEDQL